MEISVILPAKNEEKIIAETTNSILEYLKKSRLKYEIIIVENGSTDNTFQIANLLKEKNKRVRVERILEAGYGKALIRGFKKSKGKYVVFYNVDFWDKRFIDLARANLLGYDLISCSKNLPGSKDRRPLSRRLITRGFNLFLKFFLGYSGTDTHGIKLMRKEKLDPVLKMCRTSSGIFDSELMIRAEKSGLKILELPVDISEIRPNRFGRGRFFQTPKDIWELYKAVR